MSSELSSDSESVISDIVHMKEIDWTGYTMGSYGGFATMFSPPARSWSTPKRPIIKMANIRL